MGVSKEKYSTLFFLSLLLHLIVLIALIVSFEFTSSMPVLENSLQNTEIVNAMVMDAPMPNKVMPQPKKIIPRPQPPEQPPPISPDPVKPTVSLKKQTIAISDEKQKKQDQDKIAKQLLSDIKKQASQQKKQKQKALAAAFEKDMKQLTAKSIQQQMLQEQKNIAGALQQKTRGEVNKYKALILQVISQNWIIPGSVDKNRYAQLLIRVAPGGVVLDVQVVKSSGDESLDRSVTAAIFKSSPLPVPHDSDAFDQFRQFVLKVKPENILNSAAWNN